jgi:PAT family beta-lactamase induction signal transducer AmpG
MTHYAFETAFMNLVLVPTQMASGPLADSLGFKEFFYLVMFAMIPSLLAAWFVPFPQLAAPDEETSVDDESLLDRDDKSVQKGAQRATIFALLAVVLFLYPDILCIGWMSGAESGQALVGYLSWFGISAIAKIWFCMKAIVSARRVLAQAKPLQGGRAYVSNATGALIAGAVMVAVTFTLAYFNFRTYQSTNWECAFGDDAEVCIQGEAKEKKLDCDVEYIQRTGGLAPQEEEEGTTGCKKERPTAGLVPGVPVLAP